VAATTHTRELRQVAEINERLAQSGTAPDWTAARLVLGGAAVDYAGVGGVLVELDEAPGVATELPADAVLMALDAVGPPSFPYVYGLFRAGSDDPLLAVSLHTRHLRTLSSGLHCRMHLWGV
jgi:hypothetical protein